MIIWTYAQIHCLHMYTYICIHMPDVGIHRWRAKQQTIHSMAAARGARWRRWIAGRLANISVICPRPDVLPAMVSTEPHPEHWVLHSTSFFWGAKNLTVDKERQSTNIPSELRKRPCNAGELRNIHGCGASMPPWMKIFVLQPFRDHSETNARCTIPRFALKPAWKLNGVMVGRHIKL